MITKEQIKEIRKLLEKSEHPLFLFDDDPDGLCSYLLLKRKYQKGKGICVKASPKVEANHYHWIEENNPDLIVILDKPILSQDFIDQAKVPILWIDHHPINEVYGVKYYNPLFEDKEDFSPTSYWCYEIVEQDLWIGAVGTIADWNYSTNIKEFKKQYPELSIKNKNPEDWLFDSKLGKLVKIFNYCLKGKSTEVKRCIHYLEKIKSPYEILNQTTKEGKLIYKYAEKINKEYENLLKKAKKGVTSSKLLVFTYPTTKISFTSTLSNELMHLYPKKDYFIIGRVKPDRVILSLRSRKKALPPIIEECLSGLDGYGGGHDPAAGGNIAKEDFSLFLERFKKLI